MPCHAMWFLGLAKRATAMVSATCHGLPQCQLAQVHKAIMVPYATCQADRETSHYKTGVLCLQGKPTELGSPNPQLA